MEQAFISQSTEPAGRADPNAAAATSARAMSASPALLAAAAGVGFGHAILPDHWVPLAVLGRTRRYPLAKLARLSGLAGIAHVLISIVLGARDHRDRTAVPLNRPKRAGHDHRLPADRHRPRLRRVRAERTRPRPRRATTVTATVTTTTDADHDREPRPCTTGERGVRGLAAIMVPFGAAASPDLTILPVFLAATTAGVATAVGSLVIFAAVTIGTIVGLTLTAAKGGYQIRGEWLERWGNTVTALVLVVIGALVLTGAI